MMVTKANVLRVPFLFRCAISQPTVDSVNVSSMIFCRVSVIATLDPGMGVSDHVILVLHDMMTRRKVTINHVLLMLNSESSLPEAAIYDSNI